MSREHDRLMRIDHGDPQCGKKQLYVMQEAPPAGRGSILTMNDGKASVHEAFHVFMSHVEECLKV